MFERIMLVLFAFLVWYSLPPDYRKRVMYQVEDNDIAVNGKYARYDTPMGELFDGTIMASLIEKEK